MANSYVVASSYKRQPVPKQVRATVWQCNEILARAYGNSFEPAEEAVIETKEWEGERENESQVAFVEKSKTFKIR